MTNLNSLLIRQKQNQTPSWFLLSIGARAPSYYHQMKTRVRDVMRLRHIGQSRSLSPHPWQVRCPQLRAVSRFSVRHTAHAAAPAASSVTALTSASSTARLTLAPLASSSAANWRSSSRWHSRASVAGSPVSLLRRVVAYAHGFFFIKPFFILIIHTSPRRMTCKRVEALIMLPGVCRVTARLILS